MYGVGKSASYGKICDVVSLPFGEGGPQTLRLRWMRYSKGK